MKRETLNVLVIFSLSLLFFQCAKEKKTSETVEGNNPGEIVYIQNNLVDVGAFEIPEEGKSVMYNVREDGSIFEYEVSDEFPTESEADQAFQTLTEEPNIKELLDDPNFDGQFDDPEKTEAYNVLGNMFEELLVAYFKDQKEH